MPSNAVLQRTPYDDSFRMEHFPVYEPRIREADRTHFGLSDEQVATFHRDGFLVIRGLFSADEVATWRDAMEWVFSHHSQLLDHDNIRFDMTESNDARGLPIPWKVDPFTDLHPTLGHIVRDRRICDALCSLYDGYEPVLFKEKYIMKPPGSKGNGIHQDYNWWQGFPQSAITATIAIDPGNKLNGCTQLWPGTHKLGFVHQPGTLSGGVPEEHTQTEPFYLETQPGDVAFFHCFTIHAAGNNCSEDFRRQIFITYNSEKDGEFCTAHRRHFWDYRCRHNHVSAQNSYFR